MRYTPRYHTSRFSYWTTQMLRHGYSTPCWDSLFRHSENITPTRQYWNINQLCIDYSLQPHLSTRLTQGGRTLPWKHYPYGDTNSYRIYRYSCLDTHFQPVHHRSPLWLLPCWNALLPLFSKKSPQFRHTASVPIIFGAKSLDRSAITHCLNDGCFWANIPIVHVNSPPFIHLAVI